MDHENRFEDREDAPFLGEETSPSPPRRSTPANKSATDKLRIRLMITLLAVILLVETGSAMTQGPLTRILESIACKNYYLANDPSKIGNDGQVPEDQCKGDEVQGEVAIVKGYTELFDGLASIVLAIPYGLLADRIGRKPTICLSIPGFCINIVSTAVVLWFSNIFPLRFIWFASLAWLFGGGLVVASAVIWTMMADVTTEAERSAVFFQLGVVAMLSEGVSNALGSWLMVFNPWYPTILGWGIILSGIFVVWTIPETLHAFSAPKSKEADYELSPLPTPNGVNRVSGAFGAANAPPVVQDEGSLRNWRRRVQSALSEYAFVVADKQIMLLLSAFLVYRLSRGTTWFLIQYVSVRYEWSLARANLLVSLKSALMVFLLVVVLPTASWYLIKKRGVESRRKDFILSKVSVVNLLVGTLGIGLSPNSAMMILCLIIQTQGAGFVYTARSLVTTMIRRDETARLYTIIEIIQALGSILASPTMTTFFYWGLRIGGVWVGLAWIVASGLFAVVGCVIWSVRLPPRPASEEDVDEPVS